MCWWRRRPCTATGRPSPRCRAGSASAPGRRRSCRLAATTTTSAGSTRPAASSGARARVIAVGVAAGVRRPGWRRRQLALARAARAGRRSRCRRGRRRSTRAQAAAVAEPVVGAEVDDEDVGRQLRRRPRADSPCGRARKTTSALGELARRRWPRSTGRRARRSCGCSAVTGLPALRRRRDQRADARGRGGPASRRSSSPPA